MTEEQAERLLAELKRIRICAIVFATTVVIWFLTDWLRIHP